MIIKDRSFALTRYSVQEVILRLKASDGSSFKMHVSEDGLRFYGDESSAGGSIGKPIEKSVDDIWEWVGGCGDNIPLKDRAEVNRSRKRDKPT